MHLSSLSPCWDFFDFSTDSHKGARNGVSVERGACVGVDFSGVLGVKTTQDVENCVCELCSSSYVRKQVPYGVVGGAVAAVASLRQREEVHVTRAPCCLAHGCSSLVRTSHTFQFQAPICFTLSAVVCSSTACASVSPRPPPVSPPA